MIASTGLKGHFPSILRVDRLHNSVSVWFRNSLDELAAGTKRISDQGACERVSNDQL
jgi:hypothetical protein